MSQLRRLLIVGLGDAERQDLCLEIEDCEVVCRPDGPKAVADLRAHRSTTPVVVLDAERLGDEFEELVIYLKGAFPETLVAVLNLSPGEDQRRLKLLGVSSFLTDPLSRKILLPLLHRATELSRRRAAPGDWSVTVDKGDWIEISVPSQEGYVSRIQELMDLLEQRKLDQDTLDELTLAIDELVHNAMEWGNRYDTEKRVRVSYYFAEDRILLKVEDEGEGFNVSALGDPSEDLSRHMAARAEAGKRPGGLGIHMIRNLMDECIYNDRGNIVMLTKYLKETAE